MINPTTTCDACGQWYEYTSSKDRCPVCCPEQTRDDDDSDDCELVDETYDDDD